MMVKTALLIGLMGMLAACANDERGASANTASTERERPVHSSAPSAVTPAASTNTPPPGEAANGAATGAGRVASGGSDISRQDTIGPATALECTQRGGSWRRAGIMKLEVCDMPTRDAGKACRGKSDCESVCVALDRADPSGPVTGLCYRSTITVGTCLTLVEGGRIAQAQCAD